MLHFCTMLFFFIVYSFRGNRYNQTLMDNRQSMRFYLTLVVVSLKLINSFFSDILTSIRLLFNEHSLTYLVILEASLTRFQIFIIQMMLNLRFFKPRIRLMVYKFLFQEGYITHPYSSTCILICDGDCRTSLDVLLTKMILYTSN